ncbi:MAG: SpoVT/AbrB protein [uncultured bacterium]|nr:MAG: SpoVT/AbrB protein [uncultured bacterium]
MKPTKNKKTSKLKKPAKIKQSAKTSSDTKTTTVFTNGQSQAIRIPKEFRVNGKKVYIKKVGNCLIIIPIDDPWRSLINACGQFSDDFIEVMENREKLPPQERDWSTFK